MTKQNILLIDDEDNDAILIKRALAKVEKQMGFQWARDGEEGIAYLAGEREFKNREKHPFPDLVVLDLKMPRKNGFEVLRWVRGREDTKLLRIIVFTSSKESSDINKAYELGANAFMVKPSAFDDLCTLIGMIHTYWIGHCLMPDPFVARRFQEVPSIEAQGMRPPL